MRKLATVRRIDSIRSIDGADAIECAVVGGWTVVTKKGEFQPGDLAIYCEIDSWIPHELAPFLSRGQEPREHQGIRGERLRTVKLRGQLSQGLLLPFTATLAVKLNPKLGARFDDYLNSDVADLLGIIKYEPPIPAQLAGDVKGVFPGFIPKTDQERIQNLSSELEQWKADGLLWEVTEKLDGSSMTVYFYDNDVGVCSRNLELKDTASNTLWQVAHRNGIVSLLYDLSRNIALQGEIIGEGIQGNPYKIRGQSFYVFDIYDIDQGRYFSPVERQLFCELYEILHVPIVENLVTDAQATVGNLLMTAEGPSVLNSKTEREGLVFKSTMQPNLSFKAISNRFLLKSGG